MTVTSPADHAVLDSGETTVYRNLSICPREIVFQDEITAIVTDADSNGIIALDHANSWAGSTIFSGMTVDIGTTAGARDIGSVRLRYWNSTNFRATIAETAPADLPVEVGHFLTIRLEFLPWSIPKRIVLTRDGGGNITAVTEYLDYDLTYPSTLPEKGNITAGTHPDGTPIEVKRAGWIDPITGYRSVTVTMLDSVVHEPGGSLSTPTWGALSVSGSAAMIGNFDDPTVTFQFQPGFYYLFLWLGSITGAFYTYIPIWADDPANPQFTVTNFNVTSDESEFGREMQLEFYGDANEADETVIPKTSQVCYWEEASLNDGDPPASYRDQCLGWVFEDKPLLKLGDSKYGIRFGATASWKPKFRANSITLIDTGAAATTYTEMQQMTVDRVLDFSLRAVDTLRSLVNVYYSGVTAEVERMTLPLGNAWTHLTETAPKARMAQVLCDSLGNIRIQRHYSYLSSGGKLAALIAIALVNTDWTDQAGLELPTEFVRRVGAVNASGELWSSGDRILYASRAPGLREGYGTGQAKLPDQFLELPTPQADLNRLAGYHYWHENNPRPSVVLTLAGNMDVLEPGDVIEISWNDASVSGTILSAVRFIVRRVSVEHNADPDETTPPKRITLTLEQATDGPPGETAPVLQMEGVEQIDDDPEAAACTDAAADFSFAVTNCSVAFTNTSTGTGIIQYLWDFGDGWMSTLENPTHVYTAAGTYTVTLIAVTSCETYDLFQDDVTIAVESVIADFTYDVDYLSVSFTDTSTADSGVVSWLWDFGDGETSTEQNPTHAYATPGSYDVTLTVTSDCGNSDSHTEPGVPPIADPPACPYIDFQADDGGFVVVDFGEWLSGEGWATELTEPGGSQNLHIRGDCNNLSASQIDLSVFIPLNQAASIQMQIHRRSDNALIGGLLYSNYPTLTGHPGQVYVLEENSAFSFTNEDVTIDILITTGPFDNQPGWRVQQVVFTP